MKHEGCERILSHILPEVEILACETETVVKSEFTGEPTFEVSWAQWFGKTVTSQLSEWTRTFGTN